MNKARLWQQHWLGAALERARGERGGRVAVRQRQHRARQRLLLLAVALPAALRYRHCAASKYTTTDWFSANNNNKINKNHLYQTM